MAIRNIIFDLCGPIITIDCGLIDRAFRCHGVEIEDNIYDLICREDYVRAFEEGMITVDEFCSSVRRTLNVKLSDDVICDIWNTLIVAMPKENISILKMAREHYKTFLLSNSDVVNATYFADSLKLSMGFDVMTSCFDEAFFSHSLKARKPSAEAFGRIIDLHHLKVEETLFIDDTLRHIEGARALGLHTLHLTGPLTLSDCFDATGRLLNI